MNDEVQLVHERTAVMAGGRMFGWRQFDEAWRDRAAHEQRMAALRPLERKEVREWLRCRGPSWMKQPTKVFIASLLLSLTISWLSSWLVGLRASNILDSLLNHSDALYVDEFLRFYLSDQNALLLCLALLCTGFALIATCIIDDDGPWARREAEARAAHDLALQYAQDPGRYLPEVAFLNHVGYQPEKTKPLRQSVAFQITWARAAEQRRQERTAHR
jgi:hypothetical protein